MMLLLKFLLLLSIVCGCSSPLVSSKRGPASKQVVSCAVSLGKVSLQQNSASQRLLSRIEQFQLKMPVGGSPEELAEKLATDESRRITLQLQALLRIYKVDAGSKENQKLVKDLLKDIADFEGQVGGYMLRRELENVARDLKAPDQIIEFMAEARKAKLVEYVQYMKDNRWFDPSAPKMNQWAKAVSKIDFKSNSYKDKKLIVKNMVEYTDEARQKVADVEKFIILPVYDHDSMENGVHRFRRAIRWLLFMIQSSDGVFSRTPLNQSSLDAGTKPYIASKYISPTSPTGQEAATLDPVPLVRMARIVEELGLLKDWAERKYFFADAFLGTGLAANETEAIKMSEALLLTKLKAPENGLEHNAQELFRYYQQYQPLEALKRDLIRQSGQ